MWKADLLLHASVRGKHARRLFINENDKERDPMLFNDVQDKKGSASVLKYERK